MVASALLASTLKLDGSITLQIQTNGPLKLLIAECNENLGIRGTVKWSGPIASIKPIELIKEGHFIITLMQKMQRILTKALCRWREIQLANFSKTTCYDQNKSKQNYGFMFRIIFSMGCLFKNFHLIL